MVFIEISAIFLIRPACYVGSNKEFMSRFSPNHDFYRFPEPTHIQEMQKLAEKHARALISIHDSRESKQEAHRGAGRRCRIAATDSLCQADMPKECACTPAAPVVVFCDRKVSGKQGQAKNEIPGR